MLYPLPEILLLLLCATMAGADDFVEIALWGNEHLEFLRRFLPYKRGIPSHDMLSDVIAAIDPELFKTCFPAWVGDAARGRARPHRDGRQDLAPQPCPPQGPLPLHTVSAWATGQRLVLGQEAVSGKSNEIIAIPALLERLDLRALWSPSTPWARRPRSPRPS